MPREQRELAQVYVPHWIFAAVEHLVLSLEVQWWSHCPSSQLDCSGIGCALCIGFPGGTGDAWPHDIENALDSVGLCRLKGAGGSSS